MFGLRKQPVPEMKGKVFVNAAQDAYKMGLEGGMVQANVGQKLLKCNIFKSFLRDLFRVGDATFR